MTDISLDAEEYFLRQIKTPYRSTLAFCSFLEHAGVISKTSTSRVLDVGAGMGETLFYMGPSYPKCRFVGMDNNAARVSAGNELISKTGLANVRLEEGDVYAPGGKLDDFDGIVSLQTLSWLPKWEAAFRQMLRGKPKWLALSSLFYEGPIHCETQVYDYGAPQGETPYLLQHYNTISLPLFRGTAQDEGYRVARVMPFEIDCDLPRPEHNRMGTYTVRTEAGARLQLSGPLLMNWSFALVLPQ